MVAETRGASALLTERARFDARADEIPVEVLEAAIAVRYAQEGKRPASPDAERIMRAVADLEHERGGLVAKLAAIVKPR
jgi:hypothetical protein